MNSLSISTERTVLRLIEMSDLNSIHELHSLPETDEFNTLGIPKNIEETKANIEIWVNENQSKEIKNYTFSIEHKNDNVFIGLFGLKADFSKNKRAEVWYKLHPNFWNKGLATETLKAVIDFGFNKLNLHRIEAGCAVANLGSIKVLEKAGMTLEGRKRQVLPLKTGWSDNFSYAILESDER